jgi:hypothetical protein
VQELRKIAYMLVITKISITYEIKSKLNPSELQFKTIKDYSHPMLQASPTHEELWWCLLKNTTFHEVALLGTVHVLKKKIKINK